MKLRLKSKIVGSIVIIETRDCPLQLGDIFKTKSGTLILIYLQLQELLISDFSTSLIIFG